VNTGARAASGTWKVTASRAPTGSHCAGMQKARVTCGCSPWRSQNLLPVIASPPPSARTRARAV
jgi:hypothetical protein